MHPKKLSISDFTYELPESRIAAFPLSGRDSSKLLVYKQGQLQAAVFRDIASHLPSGSLLVFNNTRVIRARLPFRKPTGAAIEIFCLEPMVPYGDYAMVIRGNGPVTWKCLVGGAAKWKEGPLYQEVMIRENSIMLTATLVQKEADAYSIKFDWAPATCTFGEILEAIGQVPLPPYIKRAAEDSDKERYQTVYARQEGSVAAPTAGLHFSETIIETLRRQHIAISEVTLHVGAGTFKPVKSEWMEGHDMHAEWMDVGVDIIRQLALHTSGPVIATGTTSLRTIESFYWMGVKLLKAPGLSLTELAVAQWEVYENDLQHVSFSRAQALLALADWMEKQRMERLVISTQILIAPGYRFRVAEGLVTNFHQPNSTLLLLVAAAVGEDWRRIYQYALENDFRFLSYGDSSLLMFSPERVVKNE